MQKLARGTLEQDRD